MKKERAQDKWNRLNGLKSYSYKLRSEIADAFADECERRGVSKKSQIERLMVQFLNEEEGED